MGSDDSLGRNVGFSFENLPVQQNKKEMTIFNKKIVISFLAKADNFDTNETIFGNRKHWLVIASSGMKRKHGFNIAGFTSGLYLHA